MLENEHRLRIITLNTWKGDGAYTRRLELMANQLRTLEPDLLCLQEVLQTGDKKLDTADFLAKNLTLERVFSPARLKKRDVENVKKKCYSGLAILSAHPIIDHQIDILTGIPEDPDRIALTAKVEVEGAPILLTNLHLTHIENADNTRLNQLRESFEAVKKQATGIPWFCCGDLNCYLDKARLKELQQLTGLHIEDCYLTGGGQLPGATLIDPRTRNWARRIDYILNLTQQGSPQISCRNSSVVLDSWDAEGVSASDHYGVMTDIIISAKPTE